MSHILYIKEYYDTGKRHVHAFSNLTKRKGIVMSMPIISPSTTSPCQAITDLLESIALQEAGLAHIINAEGEKIQKALEIEHVSVADLIAINQSVSDTLIKVIKLEMVLEFKLEEVNRLDCPSCPPCPPNHHDHHDH